MTSAFDEMFETSSTDAMIATFGETVTYGSKSITAIVDRSGGVGDSNNKDTKRYDDSEGITTDWTLKVLVEDVATPAANDKVTIGGIAYYVRPVGTSGGLHTMTITRFDRVAVGPKSRMVR